MSKVDLKHPELVEPFPKLDWSPIATYFAVFVSQSIMTASRPIFLATAGRMSIKVEFAVTENKIWGYFRAKLHCSCSER